MVHTLPDIVGSGTPAAVTAASAIAPRWVEFTATGSGVARVGDASVSTARGLAVVAGGDPVLFPWSGETGRYALPAIWAAVPIGCTLQVLYGD